MVTVWGDVVVTASGAADAVGEVLTSLGDEGLAAVTGFVASLLVQGYRKLAPRAWARWTWLGRILAVALASAAMAVLSGWAAGLGGWTLLAHGLTAFVAALGWRQVLKRLGEMADPPELTYDPIIGRTSIRTPVPGPRKRSRLPVGLLGWW